MAILNYLLSIFGKKKPTSSHASSSEISLNTGDESFSANELSIKNNSLKDSQGRIYVQKHADSFDPSGTFRHQGIPPRSIYEMPLPKNKQDIVIKDLGTTVIGSISPGVNLTMRATIEMSGVIPPTVEEVDECFSNIEWFITSPDSMDSFDLERDLSPFEELFSTDKSFYDFKNTSPLSYDRFIKALRAKIRELNKIKEDETLYLEALAKAVYLKDMASEFELKGSYKDTEFCIVHARLLLTGEALEALLRTPLDFKKIGYELFPSFGKTDVKWLLKKFDDPVSHLSPANLIMDLKRMAVVNYFHTEREKNPLHYKNSDSSIDSLAWSLKQAINTYLGFHKSWYQRNSNRGTIQELETDYLKQAVAVMGGEFVVADLETTGLDPVCNEIIEFGAMLISSDGKEISRFQLLVNPEVEIPSDITKITGISDELIRASGVPPAEALSKFVDYVGSRPIFFHNSRFDVGFLRVASEKSGIRLRNIIFDSLTLSRLSWTGLGNYSLSHLSNQLGIESPTHRAISDVMSTHQLLMKIKDKYSIKG